MSAVVRVVSSVAEVVLLFFFINIISGTDDVHVVGYNLFTTAQVNPCVFGIVPSVRLSVTQVLTAGNLDNSFPPWNTFHMCT